MPGNTPVKTDAPRAIRIDPFDVRLSAPADPDALVRLEESRGDAERAYWAHVWPASVALAQHVARSALVAPDMRILEIGCGIGLVGVTASLRGCDAVMKLAPVMHWLVRERPKLKVVQTGITRELLGVCVRKGDTALRDAIDRAQQALRADGTLTRLVARWLGEGATLAP